jgi:hypothetical protein
MPQRSPKCQKIQVRAERLQPTSLRCGPRSAQSSKGLQTAAKEGKNVAEQVAAGGTRVDIWLKWAKKYALPLIGFLVVLALATAAIAIFAIASVVSSVFGDKGGACASGATDLAILATSGPVT